MSIRKATTQDTDAVTQIYDHIHDCEEAGTMMIGWQRGVYPVRATAETAVSLGDLFVLEDGGKILAAGRINQRQVPEYAAADWLYKAADNDVWVLHTLVVEPSANGRGYARAFLEFYENYALERGCHVLRIDHQRAQFRCPGDVREARLARSRDSTLHIQRASRSSPRLP